jgi:outer membrane protein OmpA-like peptidoglycan-associated protein
MKSRRNAVRGAIAILLSLEVVASVWADDPAPTQVRSFISCPVYRDTDAGRKSGCWLANDPQNGVRYDISLGRIKPLLGRQVLVEGIATNKDAGLCGGTVLEPVRVSVLEATCKEYSIPAEGFPGRRFVLPARLLQPTNVPRQLPPPPYSTRDYTIFFELNNDFLIYQYAETIIEDISLYARASHPRRVVITGYAATTGYDVSGQRIAEKPEIAHARAAMVAEALERLGVPKALLELKWQGEPQRNLSTDEGLLETAKRRATIEIVMK